MDVYEAIGKRRTVHKYKKEDVSQDQLKRVLEAGLKASSAFNQQPWEFIIVSDEAQVEKLAQYKYEHNMQGLLASNVPQDEADKLAGTQRDAFKNAVSVAVIYDKGKLLPSESSWSCIATIWLAVVAEGLGMSPGFFGLHAQAPLKELLQIPDGYDIAAILRIGVPEVMPDAKPRKSLEECIHYGHFGGKVAP